MSGSRAARKEVSEWLKGQASEAGDDISRLEIVHVKEDERRIVLKTASGEVFSITFQADYPSSSDEYLFLETDSKVADFVAVINDLRDFVYGQPPSLSLTKLLDQLKRYLEKKAKKSKGIPGASSGGAARGKDNTGGVLGGGEEGWSDDEGQGGGTKGFLYDEDDDGVDGDNDDGDDAIGGGEEEEDDGNESDYVYEEDDDDAEGGTGGGESGQVSSTWLDEHYKKRTWESKERELRKEMAANRERKAKEDAINNKGAPTKKVENIFTSRASSAVLTQDLLDIQRLEHELGMEVEAVDDNIFHWKVKINKVRDSSPLAEDLCVLRKSYAYGYVEMELTFTMDLYPFYPPLVKLVRPRFQGFMMGRITSLEMLQLSKWSSVRGMKGVLLGIRMALETWGRLDLDSELNDVIVHPEGSYTELEHLLMRLGLVTEIRPHASEEFDEDALWEAVDMRDEAQDKAHRHGSQDQSDGTDGSSVERKRKRSGAAAAAAASRATVAAPKDENGNPGSVAMQGTGVKGAPAVGDDSLNGTNQAKKPGLAVTKRLWAEEKGQKANYTGKDSDQLLDTLLENLGTATEFTSAASIPGALPKPMSVSALDGSGGSGHAAAKLKAFLSSSGMSAGGGGSESGKSGFGAGIGINVGGVGNGIGGVYSAGAEGGTKKNRQYWAAGTGYGHSGAAGEKWDVEAYLAAQREQDRLKEDLLQEIAYLMRPDERHTFPEHASSHGNSSSNSSDAVASRGLLSRRPAPEANEGRGSGGDMRGKTARGKGKEKEKAAAGGGASDSAAAASAATGADRNDVSVLAAAAASSTEGGGDYGTSWRRRKKLTYIQEIYRVDSVRASLRVLEESCLVPFLQQLLENDSLLDVDRHASLYTSVFKLIKCITAWRPLHPLLCPMKGQAPGKSLYRLLSRLGDRAKIYRSTTAKSTAGKKSSKSQQNLGKTTKGSKAEGWKRGGGKKTGGASNAGSGSVKGGGEEAEQNDQGSLTDLLLEAVREVEEVVDTSFVEELERASITRPMEQQATRSSGKASAPSGGVRGSRGRGRAGKARGWSCSREEGEDGGGEGTSQEEDCEVEGAERRYRKCMAPLQYVELEDLEGFCYKSESALSVNRTNPQRVKRLGQEHADLSQSLPLSLSSSVFVRTHEDQMDWMQVMISGPEDTPYSGGLFAFDIFFPSNYPQCPPKVKLMTTGGGQHRFNPNLYADGKVCLSLLGTWDGDKGESWNSQTSTLLQVLVSIQSLILVPEPFFNEPGYERQLGTEQGKAQSWEYSARQREATIRLGMLDMINRPPVGFEEVVKRHFYLRRTFLKRLMDRYVNEAKEHEKAGSAGHLSKLQGQSSKLKEKLAKLSSPLISEP